MSTLVVILVMLAVYIAVAVGIVTYMSRRS